MPWISNEAAALKNKVSGLTVTDAASTTGRPVNVWFWDPEYEFADLTFPCIILQHSGISKADDREHRGSTLLPYVPEQFNTANGTAPSFDPATGTPITWDTTTDYDPTQSPFRVVDYPIPYNVDFQVDVYSRFQTELMPLIGQLSAIDRLPVRFGYLEVPQDATIRSLDLIGGPEIVADKDAEGKRLFRAVYSVRVYSELNLYDVEQITSVINKVNLTVSPIVSTS